MDYGDCIENGVATLRCIPVLILNIRDSLFMWVGIVAVFIIVISGIKLMLSGGDSAKLKSAKKTFIYAVSGLTIVILSFLIIQIIAYITGVQCLTVLGFNNCSQ